ncbi:MAG: hypothetical protein RJA24_1539, partial [Pseudomonadota bacterium]
AQKKFFDEFVATWSKVMNLDRYDLTGSRCSFEVPWLRFKRAELHPVQSPTRVAGRLRTGGTDVPPVFVGG